MITVQNKFWSYISASVVVQEPQDCVVLQKYTVINSDHEISAPEVVQGTQDCVVFQRDNVINSDYS